MLFWTGKSGIASSLGKFRCLDGDCSPQWTSGERVQFRAGDRGAHTAVTITGERARAWRDFGGNEGR
jgi:hypothetical protein